MAGVSFSFTMARETERLLKRMRNMPDKVEIASKRASQRCATEYAARVIETIEGQLGTWDPLSQRWVDYKAKSGLDPRFFIATHNYVNSIHAGPVGGGQGIESWGVTAEMPKALWLENGTNKVPARPHWAPTLRKMNSFINVAYREELMHVLTSG